MPDSDDTSSVENNPRTASIASADEQITSNPASAGVKPCPGEVKRKKPKDGAKSLDCDDSPAESNKGAKVAGEELPIKQEVVTNLERTALQPSKTKQPSKQS